MAFGHQGIKASASNPNRKGGSVSARPRIARDAQRDKQVVLCERDCRSQLMQLRLTLVHPHLRVGLLGRWPSAIGVSGYLPVLLHPHPPRPLLLPAGEPLSFLKNPNFQPNAYLKRFLTLALRV
jgi:hypothetical protein